MGGSGAPWADARIRGCLPTRSIVARSGGFGQNLLAGGAFRGGGRSMQWFRYDRYGAVVGVGLPLVGTFIEALRDYGSVAPRALLAAHVGQPLLWIMDTAPVVLGGLGMIIVRQHRDLVRQSDELVRKSEESVRLEQARRDSLTRTASELFHAAQGLLGNVSEFSSTTARTAASVRETTATMNQLSQTASSAALTAETVIGLALQSERVSEEGLRHAEGASVELLRLAEDVRGLSTRIEGLSTRMRDIFEVATLVSDISDRAERVAAAAETAAERAGPAAAELHAVASEMRGLAEGTRRAVDDVKGILADVQRAVLAALSAAESGSARAAAGAKVAAETGDVIMGLSTTLRESARAAREIARVAQQQESSIERALKAMNGIAHATDDTMASTQHVAREARSLNALASSLQTVVKP